MATIEREKLYIQVTVELEVEMTVDEAIDWGNDHTVFDMLDKNASVSGYIIYNENRDLVVDDI